jgi:hypothetical protein
VVELVTCTGTTKTIKGKTQPVKRCTVKLLTGPAKFTAAGADRATLTRGGRVYATGQVVHGRLVLHQATRLRRGRYVLTIRTRAGGRWTTNRQLITIS